MRAIAFGIPDFTTICIVLAFTVVANFSVVSKDDEGNKVYHNCSAYGKKSDIPKDFKQGDFVKLFG